MSVLLPYPCGKKLLRSEITLALARACDDYRLPYREPFLGGGTLALHFLDFDRADKFWLNDLDVGVVCFWKSVIERPEALLRRIDAFEPSVAAYHEAKRVLLEHLGGVPTDPIQMTNLGFSQLVVSKLAYSGMGIVSGTPRGGHAQDNVERWRENRTASRWSGRNISSMITNYSFLLNRVETRITNLDFSTVISDESVRCALFLDPPYWVQGQVCYLHPFVEQDHERLAELLKRTCHAWTMTYDDCKAVRELYDWATIEEITARSWIVNGNKPELLIYPKTTAPASRPLRPSQISNRRDVDGDSDGVHPAGRESIAANKRETDWSQRYRPIQLKDCILPVRIKTRLEQMVSNGVVENLILHGSYGVGKTATANALCREVGCECYSVNGSLENSIGDLRKSIAPFACTRSFDGSKKVLIIDEAERLSKEYQDGLRAFMESVSLNCTFVFTTNDVSKISGALQSRCFAIDFSFLPEEAESLKPAFIARLNQIVVQENATCDPARLDQIVAAVFPDFRQILKRVQQECGR